MKKIFIFIVFILTLPAISKADRIPTNANAELYTVDGRYMAKASKAHNLPKGVYLVKAAGKWIKIRN